MIWITPSSALGLFVIVLRVTPNSVWGALLGIETGLTARQAPYHYTNFLASFHCFAEMVTCVSIRTVAAGAEEIARR